MEPAAARPLPDILKATGSFPAAARIGEGATGEVLVDLLDGMSVPVKRLKLTRWRRRRPRRAGEAVPRRVRGAVARYRHSRIAKLLACTEDETPGTAHPSALVLEAEGALARPTG